MQGSHREALDTHAEWTPRSWCGTCADSIGKERTIAMARCHVALGDALAAGEPGTWLSVAGKMQRDGRSLAALGQAYAALDEDAIDDLCKRVVRGEHVALMLVEHGKIQAAERAVRSRIALHPEQRPHLERVLRALD